MPNQAPITPSKLDVDARHVVATDDMTALAARIFEACGCDADIAAMVAEHLVETNLRGIESHGVMRLMQYAEQLSSGYMTPSGRPELRQNERGAWVVSANGGFGIPALHLAMEKGIDVAKTSGISVVAVQDCGHTGRLGAYAEQGADAGCLTIIIGGGGHKEWPQVAPYGGAKGRLPTNPYALGIPGGERGPVVVDFATGKIAGGWIYAARSAGVQLPPESLIDPDGNPTRDPEEYYKGGAILPMAGPKGYGLALFAELMGEAMLGPVTTEMNWLIISMDITLYNDAARYQAIAEDVLAEIRTCPPADGFETVEVPGERERNLAQKNRPKGIAIPVETWKQIITLAERLKCL